MNIKSGNMIQKLKKKLKASSIYDVVRSAGYEWLLLLIPISLFAFVGWLWFSGFSSGEFKGWCSTPIANMQIKDILIIGLVVAWFGRSGCDCKDDK